MAKLLNQSEFLYRCEEKFGTRFDLSKIEYINAKTKIIVGCKKHGWFLITPWRFLTNKVGCTLCGREYGSSVRKKHRENTKNTEWFVSKANENFGELYDYSKTVYINSATKVEIICNRHGSFWQNPNNHMSGMGCVKCRNLKDTEWFVSKSTEIFGDMYDYSLVDYTGHDIPVTIICKKHGEFIQKPCHHLGMKGCPTCALSKGELKIKRWLENNNISYIQQKQFDDCINENTGYKLRYDFYIPEYNVLIEYDGKQHFVINTYWTKETEESFSDRQFKDNIKTKYAKEKNMMLLRINYTQFKKIEKVLTEFFENHKKII